ncbi:MAG: hypothetical protein ACREEM_16675 [Blastocatellia bacterium]
MSDIDYKDDPTISDDADLWRRIPPWHFILDENLGDIRPSSAAFDDDPDGAPMSAYLAEECKEPQIVLVNHDGFGLVAITAKLARECNQLIARQPVPGPPGHIVVVGKKTDSVRKKLARAAAKNWVVRPPVV